MGEAMGPDTVGALHAGADFMMEQMAPTSDQASADAADDEDSERDGGPIPPMLVSSIDHSHKKAVSDIMWLPADVQINYRGNLVAAEHLDGNQYQFITISGDAMIYVWDTRFKQIAAEELKHIGRPKHVPTEKAQNKGEEPKLLSDPMFGAFGGRDRAMLCARRGTQKPRRGCAP